MPAQTGHDAAEILVGFYPQSTTASHPGKRIGRAFTPDLLPHVQPFQVKDGKETEVGLVQAVKIYDCDEFEVIRKNANAGFQPSRTDRELELRDSCGDLFSLPSW